MHYNHGHALSRNTQQWVQASQSLIECEPSELTKGHSCYYLRVRLGKLFTPTKSSGNAYDKFVTLGNVGSKHLSLCF